MNKKITALFSAFVFSVTLGGCGQTVSDSGNTETEASVISESAASETLSENESSSEIGNNIAEGAETASVQEIDTTGLTPIYAESLNEGVYDIAVDSSSSMFNITRCSLTVENGSMTAEMTMGGTGYLYIFMGKGENASEDGYIPFEENEKGEHTFTVPVEALDAAVDCSAFSKKKEKWYDRVLLFRADSLPLEAFGEGTFNTAEGLALADGEYTVDVTLSGGSGRASVQSPARLTVTDGAAFAQIIWGSSNYDYMIVNGEKYLCESTEGNSAFTIPVTAFDMNMPVSADTTAMSTPHEIEYTLYFDSDSIKS